MNFWRKYNMVVDLLHWGRNPQLVFESINEYYKALGHLTNENAYSISYEYNKKNGSYSDACRIHILSKARNIPNAFKKKRTTAGRINCNDYVENLRKNHNFVLSGQVYTRNFDDVFSTVPEEYISDFLVGFKESVEEVLTKRVCYVAEAIKTEGRNLQKTEQPIKSSRRTSTSSSKKKGKRDYIIQYITDFEIGEAGENLVYKYECKRIEQAKKNGKIDESIFVKWISREDDCAGYDILSYDIDKRSEKYIEVKTTSGSKNTPFYISENELNFSKKHEDNYCIYRVYGIKSKNDVVHFYSIEGNLEKQENFELSKKDYLVSLKSE